MINIDRLNHLNPDRAAQSALQCLDSVSDSAPEVQPVGLAMALLAFSRRVGRDVGDFFNVANNMLHDKEAEGPSFRAINMYMHNEVPK